jgi:hypothetical protein
LSPKLLRRLADHWRIIIIIIIINNK